MNVLNIFKKRQKPAKRQAIRRQPVFSRSFAAGRVDNLTASFTGSSLSINQELRQDLFRIRARSRGLFMDNDFAKRFGSMVKKNVIGVKGIVLQGRALDNKGKLDELDNNELERAWADWGKPQNCTVSGGLSWHDVENLTALGEQRDGEILIHMIDKPDTKYGFVIRVLGADYLDEQHNDTLPNGNRIIMGVEKDRDGLIVAYHLRDETGTATENIYRSKTYRRIDAKDIRHIFLSEWPEQARGIPSMHTAIRRLNMLGGYEEAELVAARIGASKMGFYTSADGDGYTADDADPDGQEHDDGELIDEAAPGQFKQLPDGVDFKPFDPQHPTSAFADFTKAVLRGAASGLGVAYNSLANDLEGVNFSSIRAGVLEERDHWKMLQAHIIQQLCQPVFERWLRAALMSGSVKLPFKKIDKYSAPNWQPRGWPWVDPLKDAKANRESIALGTATRSSVLAAQGEDYKDTIQQLAYEKEVAEQYGIDIANYEEPQEGVSNEQD